MRRGMGTLGESSGRFAISCRSGLARPLQCDRALRECGRERTNRSRTCIQILVLPIHQNRGRRRVAEQSEASADSGTVPCEARDSRALGLTILGIRGDSSHGFKVGNLNTRRGRSPSPLSFSCASFVEMRARFAMRASRRLGAIPMNEARKQRRTRTAIDTDPQLSNPLAASFDTRDGS